MELWMKISYAVVLGLMLIFLLPRAKAMMQNSPKPQKGDWTSVMIPLLAIFLFILFLVQMVR